MQQFVFPADRELLEVHPSSLNHVSNMCDMEELSEAAILHCLRLRFAEDIIYTNISSILVSVNPFKMLPLYSPAIMKDYRRQLSERQKVEPHVYALAHEAHNNLVSHNADQAIVIRSASSLFD